MKFSLKIFLFFLGIALLVVGGLMPFFGVTDAGIQSPIFSASLAALWSLAGFVLLVGTLLIYIPAPDAVRNPAQVMEQMFDLAYDPKIRKKFNELYADVFAPTNTGEPVLPSASFQPWTDDEFREYLRSMGVRIGPDMSCESKSPDHFPHDMEGK